MKKLLLGVFATLLVLVSASSGLAAKPEDVFVVEDGEWQVKRGGKQTEAEGPSGSQPDLGFHWIAVNPDAQEEAKDLERGVLLYSEGAEKYSFIPLREEEMGIIDDVSFSSDGKRAVVASRVGRFVSLLMLYDVEKLSRVEQFEGYSDSWWIDPHRFAFTMIEKGVELPESAGLWGTSAAVYDPDNGAIILKKTTSKEKFSVSGLNEAGDEITISVTSVESEKDWEDVDKWQESEIAVAVPAAG
jgi:hypothetical protein